jgi:plasmid stabilization system protein ParE
VRITLSREARRDRREAEAHYARQSLTAARFFRRAIQDGLRFISEYPHGAPIFRGRTRAKDLDRFPFAIVYLVLDNRLFVVAIADERRHTGAYDDRIT